MNWLRNNLVWAIRGIGSIFRTEMSVRIQLVVALLMAAAGFFFRIDRFEWIAVVLAMAIVLVAEAFNTALENLADAVHPDQHPLVGRAKDIAAGAVLIAAIAASVIGLIVFLPQVLSWLTTLFLTSPAN